MCICEKCKKERQYKKEIQQRLIITELPIRGKQSLRAEIEYRENAKDIWKPLINKDFWSDGTRKENMELLFEWIRKTDFSI